MLYLLFVLMGPPQPRWVYRSIMEVHSGCYEHYTVNAISFGEVNGVSWSRDFKYLHLNVHAIKRYDTWDLLIGIESKAFVLQTCDNPTVLRTKWVW